MEEREHNNMEDMRDFIDDEHEMREPEDEHKPDIEDALKQTAETVKELIGVIKQQQEKIKEQDRKINDIIGVMTAFLQGGGIDSIKNIIGGDPIQSQEETQEHQEQTTQQQKAITIDKIVEALKYAAILATKAGAPRERESGGDVITSIQNALSLASGIAGALGEGVGKMFDSFNAMQERAFRAAMKFKTEDSMDESKIEKVIERVLDKKLKNIRGGENE